MNKPDQSVVAMEETIAAVIRMHARGVADTDEAASALVMVALDILAKAHSPATVRVWLHELADQLK